MKNAYVCASFAVAIGAFLLTACGGSGTGVGTPAATQASIPQSVSPDGIVNVAGQYSGTIDDNKNGKGTAVASLAQFRDGVGGQFTYTYGTQNYPASTSSLLTNDSLKGATVVTVGSTVCSYSFSAKYNATKFTLDGKYKAVHGCTGENGTLSLTEQCYYARDWAAVKPQAGGLMAC